MAQIEAAHDQSLTEYFMDLDFDEESHTYHVGGVPYRSVSKTIESVVEKEDFEAIAKAIAKRDGGDAAEILAGWAAINKTAIDKGHKTHSFAEGNLRNPQTGAECAVVKFWNELDPRFKVVGKELRMYHRSFGYAGTSDLILYDTLLGEYIIADYKTNGDLFKNFKGKMLKPPFDDLLEHPFNKYQIQLSLYQLLLQQVRSPVGERWVIWITDDGNYQILKTYDMTGRVLGWLKTIHHHDNKRNLGLHEIRA